MTITTSASPQAGATEAETTKKRGGGRKKMILILVVLLALGAAAYWFFLKPADAKEAPKPGEVVSLEPIQVNLAAGHYLKIGVALQLTVETTEVDGSKALDATIDLFSNRPMEQLTRSDVRAKLKKELVKELKDRYDGEVMGVYFTDFVTQ
jgi:flagellar FliL protein